MNIRILCVVVSIGTLATTASADQEDTNLGTTPKVEWTLQTPKLISVDSSDAGNAADFKAVIDKITLHAGQNTSITLSCQTIRKQGEISDSRLNLSFDLDTEKDTFKRRMTIRRLSAALTLGDTQKTYRFQWNVNTDNIVPFDRSVARKVFNAAIRGDKVKLKISGKSRIDATLPPINDDFRAFAKACSAIQPKQ